MSSLRELSANWIKERPFLKEYMELHLAIDDVFLNTQVDELILADIKKCKDEFNQGTELINIKDFEIFEVELAERVFRELPSIAESYNFPEKLSKSIKDIGRYLVAHDNFPNLAIGKALNQESFEDFEKQGLNAGLVLLFAQKSIEKAIQTYHKTVSDFLEENHWYKKTCPVCGGVPTMAVLRKGKGGRVKYLVCGTCKTEWSIKRVECPYCDNDKQENIRIIEFDAEKDLRIDTCDACKSYIKTYTGNSIDDIAMRDFASIHIDIASKQTGFKKVGTLLILD